MIKLLVMDVDGTLTDGKIYIGPQGEAAKAFDVKDGCGIKLLLPRFGIVPVIITARSSDILSRRCAELGIAELHQNAADKLATLQAVMQRHNAAWHQVAYIGDDLPDLPCLEAVARGGGMAACPADAARPVRETCNHILASKAGEGAVRELIEHLIAVPAPTAPDSLKSRVDKAIGYLASLDHAKLEAGRHDVAPDFYFNLMEYTPADAATVLFESHRKYVDIQMLLSGRELFSIADAASLVPATTYDPARDVINYNVGTKPCATLLFGPGTTLVLYPADAHRATACAEGSAVRKIVGKLLIDHE